MHVFAILWTLLITAASVDLPAGVLFNDKPATIAQMRAIEGRWVTSNNVPAFTLSLSRPGWMSLEAGRGIPNWIGRRRFPVAVTSSDGQLFMSMSVRSILPMRGIRKSYRGLECYNTFAVTRLADGLNIMSLDEEKMRAANSWYPKELPAWEGKQFSCGDFVLRAKTARNRRVVVVLEQEPWFGTPLHRLPLKGRSASGVASE